MGFSPADIDAITESALFFRDMFDDPLDAEHDKLSKNIDSFLLDLRAKKLPGLTFGQVQNCCLFLKNFIENAPDGQDLTVHRLLLFRLTEALSQN